MRNENTVTVGAVITAFLEQCEVKAAFGVISIHNMPILDAFAVRGNIRFVMARGEAGATNMADAYARSVGGLGVCLTSTGTAAGNAAGAMVEALTAGTPLLHITGQIETPYLDQEFAYIHEARDQLTMLKSVSKAAFRVRSVETALSTLKLAVQTALTAPTGPVSVEIPIDIQSTFVPMPTDLTPLPVPVAVPAPEALEQLVARMLKAKRPLLWLGGGARHAGKAVKRLMDMGVGVITSTQGRGVVNEDDERCLGAFSQNRLVENFMQGCDALLIAGSRLRSNETFKYALKLPENTLRIDANPAIEGRSYSSDLFVCGDAALTLDALADRLEGRLQTDPQFLTELKDVRGKARAALVADLGPYAAMVEQLQGLTGRNFTWVRDVTLSNSIWGNRLLDLYHPRAGVHALGGGIGQGLAMGIGAGVAAAEYDPQRRVFALAGDGGFILNLGELATLVQEKANVVILLMNDQRYGVIRNIQDAIYGARHAYVELHTPDYTQLAESMGIRHGLVRDLKDFGDVVQDALSQPGPFLLEVDMLAVGNFATQFAGPPNSETKAQKATA
ncbi:thiamine pyrophosphate-binding protein [Pseudomonas putida]|uniref:thiamine pyrophosphate-binding protein n=1 Tax=Pseudomonas putida group TaxID=136845 RepID=UPI0018AC1CEC|nr:thiamine pyrophosphate-binding protein [Pseudomonas monteilii]MBF8748494.1 thiamine pyrophosphate-binding protein [Pseudomonas monteilii]